MTGRAVTEKLYSLCAQNREDAIMSTASKKRKEEDVQTQFDQLRQAALNEHKLHAEQTEVLLQNLKQASAAFKQGLAVPKPAFRAYEAFATDNSAALNNKKAKRFHKCSHPGCDAAMVVEHLMHTGLCNAGHHHHYCQGVTVLGAEQDCRQCQLRADARLISGPRTSWNAIIKDL